LTIDVSTTQVIAKMADVVAANLLDLEHGSSNVNLSFLNDVPSSLGADHLTFSQVEADAGLSTSSTMVLDACADLDYDLDKIVASESSDALQEWLQTVKTRQEQQFDHGRLMRILWRAVEELPADLLPFVLDTVRLDFRFVDNINGRTPLHEACIVGRMDLVKLCIERGIDIEARDAYDRRPLHYAAMHGRSSICQFLMERGANPLTTDMDGYTPLIQAVISGHVDCVQIFVADSADNLALGPTAQSNDLIPLTLACQYGHEEVARLLLRHGAKSLPNSEGLYPQHMAARSGHASICRLLIQEGGPDGGGKDRHDKYNQWTPLHHAAVGGTPRHFECVKVLVEAGCDVNATDEYGKSAGFYAGWYGVSSWSSQMCWCSFCD
jgi:CDK inhibitor PHO81